MTKLNAQSAGKCFLGLASAFALVIAFTSAAAESPTLDEVVAKHLAAKGGAEAWGEIESMKVTGNFTAFSKIKPFTLHRKAGGLYHFDQYLGEKMVVTGHDGKEFWWDNHWYQEGAQKIKGADLAVVMRDVELTTPFFDYQEKGHKAELKGHSEIEGTEAIQVDFTRSDDSVESWYLHPETYLEIARVSPASDFGRPMEQTTFFDDFREVSGVMIPFFSETQWYTRDRVMEIASIETNVEIADELFRMPSPIGMGDFQAMVGSWTVKVEERQSPRAPWTESEISSEIRPLLRGALLVERYVTSEEEEVVRSLSFDRYREHYLFTQMNETSTFMDLQKGAREEDGRLVLSNVDTGTTSETFGTTIFERTSISEISEDGFKVERENSIDGGENWMSTQKLTYSRPSE